MRQNDSVIFRTYEGKRDILQCNLFVVAWFGWIFFLFYFSFNWNLCTQAIFHGIDSCRRKENVKFVPNTTFHEISSVIVSEISMHGLETKSDGEQLLK